MGVFSDINEVRLLGNLTKDIEIKTTPSGSQAVMNSVATKRSYKVGEAWKDEVNYTNIVAWGVLALALEKYAKKGTRVLVEGRLVNRSYEKDGVTKYITEVIANDIKIFDKKIDSPVSNTGQSTDIDPDDIPF